MKIGILTFHRADNYGAVLQCYALQEILKERGDEVEVINYAQQSIDVAYEGEPKTFGWLLKRLFSFHKYFRYLTVLPRIRRNKQKRKKFSAFRKEFLRISPQCDGNHIPTDYDRYVIGSDQLFSLNITNGLDPVYSGNFPMKEGARRISYAVSLNEKSFFEIGESGWKAILNRFDAFSLRESVYAGMLSKITDVSIPSCVDPTLLVDAMPVWNTVADKAEAPSDSVVIYEVRYQKGNEKSLRQKAHRLAFELGVKTVDLSQAAYGVEEWLACIRSARCVVTSSFHATVFALLFKRPLLAFRLHDGGDARYVDLLSSLGLSTCIHDLDYVPTGVPETDYTDLESRLRDLRRSSLDYLQKAIWG